MSDLGRDVEAGLCMVGEAAHDVIELEILF